VIDLQRANPIANEDEGDRGLEVIRADRDEEDGRPKVDVVRDAGLDPAAFVAVERDFATVWDGEDPREVDEQNAGILAVRGSGLT
jgi:hypothetical protein